MTQPNDDKVTDVEFLSPGRILLKRTLGHKGFMIGAGVIAIILTVAFLSPVLMPHDPFEQNLSIRLTNPVWHDDGTWEHPLGTDALGRDYLSRLMYGARISLIIGISATVIATIIGAVLGVCAGYFGGRIDMVVSFLITTRLALPVALVGMAVVALMGGGSMKALILVLGLLIWDRHAVVMRSTTIQLRSVEYISAARAAGCSTLRILSSELLPNVLNNLIVVTSIEFARAVILEATFSFLGMGVQAPMPSWGLMIAEARDYMFFSPWMIVIPGVVLSMMLLSINMMGDGVRDITAPEGRA